MSFDLAYPLGGEEQENFLRFERIIMTIVPPWLRRTIGGAILQGIARVIDALIYRAGYGVRLRFPFVDEDSLSLAGRERRMTRGPAETSMTYSGRVQTWLDAHRRRGSVYAMLRQWYAYMGDSPRLIEVIYHSGTRYTLDVDGSITRDAITWGADGTDDWAQAWVFLYEDSDPGTLTDAQKAELLLIPRLWNAAHMRPLKVVILWPGVGLWDYPQGPWDDVEDPTWTDDEPIILEAS